MSHDDRASPTVRRRPEVLAPAGDEASLRVALASGADAVYFGLDEGFNARARAGNFSLETLGQTVARVHRAGARAYLTLNTLVFESELAAVERILRSVAEAGVDALIVQDPGLALLARAVCPTLELHASTQMTLSSPEAALLAPTLGISRVVVPRELSVAEIRRFAQGTDLELEVFVHGALCVSWSGQCLTSEAWGGRSANRGQCAQSCRMPYDLIVDGEFRDLGDVRYLLSPKDLAGLRAIPELLEIGVHGLKIEGRQKGTVYVATAVQGLRHWVDALAAAPASPASSAAAHQAQTALREMSLAYTRGFSDGFLAGDDHQTLVEGRFPKHRGLYLGRVVFVQGHRVVVAREPGGRPWTGGLAVDGEALPSAPTGVVSSPLHGLGGSDTDGGGPAPPPLQLRAGMGVVFDDGRPEDEEAGGPIFAVDEQGGDVTLTFGTPGPDLRVVAPGQRVWVNSDPTLTRRAAALAEQEPEGRIAVDLTVRGTLGAPLGVEASAGGFRVRATSTAALTASRTGGLDDTLLRDKLGGFGGTPLRLGLLELCGLDAGLHLPVSELKTLRRTLARELVAALERGPVRALAADPVLPTLAAQVRAGAQPHGERAAIIGSPPALLPLCRSEAQLEAVIAAGLPEVELDFMELVGLGRAVERARAAGLRVTIATVRVQKPGEESYDARIARLRPDAVLVRHFGALMSFARLPADGERPLLHGDFSLNVTNSLTAHHLFGLGADTLTAAHDLDRVQVFALLAAAPPERFTIALHHHIATFHTEHCVYAHLLSSGRDFHSCGRPCEQHEVSLRDRLGQEHPVIVDVGCRNTVFNAQAQSAAALVPRLVELGVRRFRVELVRETHDETARVLAAYQALLRGELSPAEAVRRAGVHEQFGVTRGTMQVLA